MSQLGAVLVEAKRPSEAESLLVNGFEGMRQRARQIPQEIPRPVWQAYLDLVAAGYDSRLIDSKL